jgi:hypothetical protein
MWKPEQRLVADRSCLRYPSDLTDSEWAIVEPMIRLRAKVGANDRSTCARCAPPRRACGGCGPEGVLSCVENGRRY